MRNLIRALILTVVWLILPLLAASLLGMFGVYVAGVELILLYAATAMIAIVLWFVTRSPRKVPDA